MTDATEETFSEAEWREQLRSHRAEKDDFFAEHPQSPIRPERRDDFSGLDYFEPDLDYRVTATVEVHEDPEPVEMDVSAGAPQRYLRVATLHFELGDDEYELAGYSRQNHEGLFVPFRDKTTGQQTYEDGRYMEFETEDDLEDAPEQSSASRTSDSSLVDGAEMVLDFNLAYSPFCAYSQTFACPLPPEENWLETEILAGEKALHS